MKRGFTLIELAVTLGIMVLLTSILIIYSRASEDQIILFKEQAKVINAIMRAKSLAIQTFAEEGAACGYGIHIGYSSGNKLNKLIIFKDLPTVSEDCIENGTYTGDKIYTPTNPDELFKEDALDERLEFLGIPRDIVFIPPDPEVIINANPILPAMGIPIRIIDSPDPQPQVIIMVTNAGQITTQ